MTASRILTRNPCRRHGRGAFKVVLILAMLGSAGPSIAVAPGASGNSWKKLSDMAVPRWEAGSVVLDKTLYVFGGYKMPTKACKRADVFDPKTGGWTKLKDLPSAVTHMNLVLDGRSIWLAGGFKDGYKGYTITEVWRYDVDKNAYSAGPALPESRGSGGLAIVGRKLHYIGGLTKDRNTCSPKHWTLDLEKPGDKWTEAKPMSKGRCHFGTVTLAGKIYVIGGMYHHDKGQVDLPLVDIYDPKTDSWSKGKDLPAGHTHAEGATFVHDGRICFMGGMAQIGRRRWIDNKITVSTPDGGWRQVGQLPRNLSAPAAGIINGELYVAGGSPNGATPQPGMWSHALPARSKPEAKGALDLFDGKSLDGWEHYLVDPKLKMSDVWSVRDGLIICKGKPMGYLATKKEFTNFRLIVEYRWAPGKAASNSGVLMRITGKPQALPKCVESQLKAGSAGDIYGFHGFRVGGDPSRAISAENKMIGKLSGMRKIRANERTPGRWNTVEITFIGGDVTVILNGQKTNEATNCDVVSGKIGLQSEGGEIHFRTVRLIPIAGRTSSGRAPSRAERPPLGLK